MKFGPLPLADALGHVLAHSMQAQSGRIAKGTVLTAPHLADLAGAGHSTVTVAQLASTDVPEDAAAQRLAAALCAAPDLGLRASGAGAGRVNLIATRAGVVVIDTDVVHQINAIDPMITLATVPAFFRADTDQMIATIKIIAYGVDETALTRAEAIAAGALRINAAQYASATLIETQLGADLPTPKGREALVARLDRLGVTLTPRVVVVHAETDLSTAIQAATGEVVFILTASATSDVHDTAPAALVRAGGHVTQFGLPVDPGNLLFFGALGNKPVIGLPGCARSVALNGADWVLERLICGLALTRKDIAHMGVGGLLKEIPTRPRPRRAKPED